MRTFIALLALTVACMCGLSADSDLPLLLQKPTLSRTHIAFVYAGDLWTVLKEGGDARRLTSGLGTETNPVFSPDGSTIAFTGEYDGNTNVYTVPAAGGVPRRLTWHPAPDIVQGWSPDGRRIVFTSTRENYASITQLFTMGVDGSFPEKLALPWGWEASHAPDGRNHEVVGVGHQHRAVPAVQTVLAKRFDEAMHVDVRQQWRSNPALRCSSRCLLSATHPSTPPLVGLFDRRLQPHLNQMQHLPIADAACHARDQLRVRNRVEGTYDTLPISSTCLSGSPLFVSSIPSKVNR
jgi:hypothetical protein